VESVVLTANFKILWCHQVVRLMGYQGSLTGAVQYFELCRTFAVLEKLTLLSEKLTAINISLCTGTLGSMQNYLRTTQNHPN